MPVLRASRCRFFLLQELSRNPLAMLFCPPSPMTPMERLLIVAISRGAEPDLIVEASSPKPTLAQRVNTMVRLFAIMTFQLSN